MCWYLLRLGSQSATVYTEIFAEQQVNRVFAIIFSRITGPSFHVFRGLVLPHGYKIFNGPSSLPSSVSRSTIDSVSRELEVS